MKQVIEDLQSLQKLAAESGGDSQTRADEVARLRSRIPPLILGHVDSLRARGRSGIAAVHNGVCTGCHLGLPSGLLAGIARHGELHRCDNCGRYLYHAAPVPVVDSSVAAMFTNCPKPAKAEAPTTGRRRRRNAADAK